MSYTLFLFLAVHNNIAIFALILDLWVILRGGIGLNPL